jgi:very-short-patch-repair endonuclease
MPSKNIVIGQKIDPKKAARARELRGQMTQAERCLWEYLRGNRLSGWHFRLQQLIAGFIVDFYCHAANLAVELDGAVHETQTDYDAERDRALAENGVRVLRIQNQELVQDSKNILAMILQACENPTGTISSPSLPASGREGDRG